MMNFKGKQSRILKWLLVIALFLLRMTKYASKSSFGYSKPRQLFYKTKRATLSTLAH